MVTSSFASLNVVYPACAGIDPIEVIDSKLEYGLPRMRGDRPIRPCLHGLRRRFTPHARGSTWRSAACDSDNTVYPACAGIDPKFLCLFISKLRLPRMRGDRPAGARNWLRSQPFTPHARGSTLTRWKRIFSEMVYPACAGIDPCHVHGGGTPQCLPRMRGDRPQVLRPWQWPLPFTPHARGSTWVDTIIRHCRNVYPACAGIDRSQPRGKGGDFSLPRMRGDRPRMVFLCFHSNSFTPHARGSTPRTALPGACAPVYPACAGIDPRLPVAPHR